MLMTFGIIDTIFNDVLLLIKDNKNYDLNNLELCKLNIYNNLKDKHNNLSYKILDEIFIRLFDIKYIFKNNICFDQGYNCFRELENIYDEIKIPKNYKKIEEHFNKLKKMPQPVQRTKEWYDYRYNRVTASDTAAAIDLNPYEPIESFILKKCDPEFPFRDNADVFHGRKYEPIATMIYEHIYNNRVFEFGALPSEKYIFLGASPDGICSKYTLDNKFSDRLGTMLEIKCPSRRIICTKGNIIGDICPHYYYCQIQQQLECCELDVCDFWQCTLSEYKNRKDYLSDNCESLILTETIDSKEFINNPKKIKFDNKLKKGLFLEFYPKNFEQNPDYEDSIEWKSKYIIPNRLDFSESEYDNWIINIMDNYKELYPDIFKNYYFNKIIYWKLNTVHNVAIKKNEIFLNNIIPILKNTWEKVVYYRKNKDKLNELRLIAEKRKKYIKINTKYTISNDIVIKDKLLFLQSLKK
jgi:putative phage-type endonuclease